MKTVPSFRLWLEFEHIESASADSYDDCFNMTVELDDGCKYAMNLWTFNFLERARRTPELESEALKGKYLVGPDLFVEKLDRGLLEQVVTDLLMTGQMKAQWLIAREDS
jgi:hypothetical protein